MNIVLNLHGVSKAWNDLLFNVVVFNILLNVSHSFFAEIIGHNLINCLNFLCIPNTSQAGCRQSFQYSNSSG